MSAALCGQGLSGGDDETAGGGFVQISTRERQIAIEQHGSAVDIDAAEAVDDVEAAGAGIKRAGGERQRSGAAGGPDVDDRAAGHANAASAAIDGQRAVSA